MSESINLSSELSKRVSPSWPRSPKVSVLMLTRNRPAFLSRAIQSVMDQSFEDWELLVIHDGTDQETMAVMDRWTKADPRIRYFRREQGGNIANATNFGASHARGEYLAILDDDDFWIASHKLEKQVAFLETHPEHVACGSGMSVVDSNRAVQMSYLKPEQDSEIRSRALCANPMAHSTTIFRRSIGESIGFYDESLAGYQDWDIWLRLGLVGKLYNFPEAFACYTLWTASGSFQQERENALSALRIVIRHRKEYGGFPAALALALAHLAYAYLPDGIRRPSFSFLSRRKKALFVGRQDGAVESHRS
jgi:glycosyltransferase involved in cell wall biosynthesis